MGRYAVFSIPGVKSQTEPLPQQSITYESLNKRFPIIDVVIKHPKNVAFSSLLKKISTGDDKVLPRLLADRQSISARENSDLIIVLAEKRWWG